MTRQELDNMVKESLRDWFKKEKWVRISTSGNIAGPCGTSKNKKNPDRCLPKAKAQSLTKAQRAATARKKKKAGAKGKTVVKNTKAATVKREHISESLKSAIEKEMRANDGRFETPFPTRELRQILNTKDHSELGDSAKKVLAKLKKKYDLNENIDNNIEALITLVKSAKNPKNLPIYFGTRSVGIGQTQYDKGELVDMFNGRELGMDSMDIRNVFFKANQDAENIADKINASNSGVVANVEYGYGKKPILYLRKGTNESKKVTKEDIRNLVVGTLHELQNEGTITEKDDRCTRIAKRKYDTWPSAYASGAVVRCRRGEIWKGVKEEVIQESDCKHGRYFCNHDKKYKCRKGPKKSR